MSFLTPLLLAAPLAGPPMASEPPPTSQMVAVAYTGPPATEKVAVPAPHVAVSGKVLMKDGVTPVRDAELVFTGLVDGGLRKTRTSRSGEYKIGLMVGEHTLQIARRMELYRSPSTYRVVAGSGLQIDFLLVPDFEQVDNPDPEPATRRRGPDPRPEGPAVVGTVVDLVHSSSSPSRRSWKELLGFLGGILAVAAASD